jgi:hypothetical protein
VAAEQEDRAIGLPLANIYYQQVTERGTPT